MSRGWRRYVYPVGTNLRADVDDELRFHVEMITQELIAAGYNPRAAQAEAQRRFGAVPPVRNACLTIDQRRLRRAERADRMSALWQDIRYAWRSIRLSPAFSFVIAITLALGIGATTAMYGVVDGVLLRPLPYRFVERLVSLSNTSSNGGEGPASYPEFKDWKARTSTAFDEMGTWFAWYGTLVDGDRAENLAGERMSASIPRMLGVQPVIGRFFHDAEDDVTADRLVVISEDFWRERFGADPTALGRTLQLSGRAFTIIGVFPSKPATRLPNELMSGNKTDLWLTLRLDERGAPRSLHFLSVMARTRASVSFENARSAVATAAAGLNAEKVTTNGVVISRIDERLARDSRKPLMLLLGAVGLLLIISCANVANLLLARAATRGREFAIRRAVGAGDGRLVAQLLAESVVRATIGGVLGVVIAIGATWWMRHRLAVTLPRFEMVAIDGRVLVFALVVSVGTGVLFGLVPALRSTRGSTSEVLREGGRGVAGSITRDRFRRALIVSEIALSFVLLVGAGLFIRSLRNVLGVERGFDTTHTVSAGFSLPAASYPDAERQLAFYAQLVERVRALPGVHSAALASNLPLDGGANGGISIEGRTFAEGTGPIAEKRIVGSGYFEAMNASLRSGRFINRGDVKGAAPVVVVNEAFVRRWFPSENPVGKRIAFSWDTEGYQTIVGVLADMHETSLAKPSTPSVYIPVEQRPHSSMFLIVRAKGEAIALVPEIRGAFRSLDPRLPLFGIRTLEDIVRYDTAGRRLTTSIFGVFASLALLLAAVGLYGVISYSVVQRTQELGIRAALGARRRDLMLLVLTQSAAFTGVGIVLGIAGAAATTRLLENQLFGVAPGDVTTLVNVGLVLGTVSAVATALPAFRATRADPLSALRQE